jgi:branched-chain amino acid transport system ATP-binding protein
MLKAIVGLVKPSGGTVSWNGETLTGLQTKDIVSRGVCLVPEGRRIFPNLTVDENLTLGAYSRSDKAEIQADRRKVFELFPRLLERAKQKAGTLSGGEQQMLAVGRALMTKPKLLMMDEPSLGLAPLIVKMIFDIVKTINAAGVTVLLVEQNARAALEIAHFGYVLETGRITLRGPGKELLADDRVRSAYLGDAHAA